MSANTAPISPIKPNPGFAGAALTAANTALDGTGTKQDLFTAGAEGARVGRVRVMHRGTNVATVMRFFMNNGNTPATAGNNTLVAEKTIPANSLNQTAESTPQDVQLNLYLAPSYKLFYTIGTAVAAGHAVTCMDGGDY